MSVIRIPLSLTIVAAGAVCAATAADQDRVWRGRDNQVVARGTLLDVQGEAVTILDSDQRQKVTVQLPELADAERQYVAHAMNVSRRFGAATGGAADAECLNVPKPAEQMPPAAQNAATTLPGKPLTALRLSVAPQIVQSFRVVGEDPYRIVVQQKKPDGIIRVVCYDGGSGEPVTELRLPEDAEVLDVSPDGKLAAVHRQAENPKGLNEHWIEIRCVDDGAVLLSTNRWRAAAFAQEFRFTDDRTLVESRPVGSEEQTVRVWRVGTDDRASDGPLQRVAEVCLLMMYHWDALQLVNVHPGIVDFLSRLNRRPPLHEWRLKRESLVYADGGQEVMTLVMDRSGLRPFVPSEGPAKELWRFPVAGGRPAVSSIGLDPTSKSIAFLVHGDGGLAQALVLLAEDGSPITRQPVSPLLSPGGSPRCVALGEGCWALVHGAPQSFGDDWMDEMTVHVFDERRRSFVWTYTTDRAMVARHAPERRFWWAMPDPDSLARTVVAGMSLPDPRAAHFVNWSVVSEKPVLSKGTAVTCFGIIDKRAFRDLHSSEGRSAGKGIPLGLKELELVEKPDADFTIFHEVVSQNRGGKAGIYNVVAGISIFDRQHRLLCRNVHVSSLEDHHGFCGDLEELADKWPQASESLWSTSVGCFQSGPGERLACGLGDLAGVGSTKLPASPEILARMSKWTPEQAELVNPLTDLAERLAAEEAKAAESEAFLAAGEPPLARKFVKSWQARIDPPRTTTNWVPKAGLRIPIGTSSPGMISHPHPATSFVAIRDRDVRCYDLRTGEVIGRLVISAQPAMWDGSALDPAGRRIAIQRTDKEGETAIEVFWFGPPPADPLARVDAGLSAKPSTPAVRVSLPHAGSRSDMVFTSRDQIVSVTGGRAITADAVTGIVQHVTSLEVQNASHVITAVSPGGCYLAHTCSESGVLYEGKTQVRLVDLRNGIAAGLLDGPKSAETRETTVGSHSGALAFSPDGRFLACFVNSCLVCWDLDTQAVACVVDVTEGYQRMLAMDREIGRLRDHRGILHWLPDGSGWLVLGCLLVNRETGKVQDALIEGRVPASQSVPGFLSRVVPGPKLFHPWVVRDRDGSGWEQGATLSEIRGVE